MCDAINLYIYIYIYIFLPTVLPCVLGNGYLSMTGTINCVMLSHKVSNIAGSGCIYIRVDFNILLDRQI